MKDKKELPRRDQLQSILESAASISHEMNQPLTGITGYCMLIQEDLNQDDPLYEEVGEIKKQAIRLEELVQRLQQIIRSGSEL
ncbi:MAG: histidine kinase dimerization/phospho-acceptor domain-containing protein [bacterium]